MLNHHFTILEQSRYLLIMWCHTFAQQILQLGDLAKGLRTPREFDFAGQWDLIRELPQKWGNRHFEGTNKTLCALGPRRKGQWPHKRVSQTCPWVSRSLGWRHGWRWPAARLGRWVQQWGTGPFEGGHHYLHYFHHSLVSGQTRGKEQSPAHQQNWIKDLLSMALPIRTRPSLPPQSVSPIRNFP